ncbi:MAG: hypothetical protein AAGJ87_13365, partial [Pseudomonadota bacterium]
MAVVQDIGEAAINVREGTGDVDFLMSIHKLWRTVYSNELGWLNSADELQADAYHDYSTYFLIEQTNEIGLPTPLATARVVSDSPCGLPIERFMPLGPLKEGRKIIETQKLMVLPEYRSRRFQQAPLGLMALIMQRVMRFAVTQNASMIIADVFNDPQISPIGPLKQIGFQKIGAPFVDTELAAPIESVAMGISRSMFLNKLFTDDNLAMLKYLRGEVTPRQVKRCDSPSPARTTVNTSKAR